MLFSCHYSNAQKNSIKDGSGSFKIEGNIGHKKDSITIFYHRPKNFNKNSRFLIVIPGAGRNADDYRNSWIQSSEEYSVLILSPFYDEKSYSYTDYHLGGIGTSSNLRRGVTFKKGTNQVLLDENIFKLNVNNQKKTWIFNDFDRIFKIAKKATKSTQKNYDLFGHSAGGQILHRQALFHSNSLANRILASNSGNYTLPNYNYNFPFGIKNLKSTKEELQSSFNKKLVIFLGELDNQQETRGKILRSKTIDKQGTNRLDRGKYFYNYCKSTAKEFNMDFNWKIEIIPNVGHNQKGMAQAASRYLYKTY